MFASGFELADIFARAFSRSVGDIAGAHNAFDVFGPILAGWQNPTACMQKHAACICNCGLSLLYIVYRDTEYKLSVIRCELWVTILTIQWTLQPGLGETKKLD